MALELILGLQNALTVSKIDRIQLWGPDCSFAFRVSLAGV